MATVIWTREAIERLREIYDYIALDSPVAATSVVNGIFAKVALLADHPRIGQRYQHIANREVRELIFGRYRIPYLIVHESRIDILGVFHGSMDIERYLR